MLSILALALVSNLDYSEAFTRRVKGVNAVSDATGDAVVTAGRLTPPSDLGLRIARSASAGVGAAAGKNYCYRAIKFIIADALGKDRKCVWRSMTQGSAKNAGPELEKMGFVKDNSKCKTPGAMRVYKGASKKGFANDKGTIHGDVQVVGDDGMYHHFLAERRPSDERKPGRRILTGCYYPNAEKIAQGPLSKCPAEGYKRLRVKPNNEQSGVD